MPTNKRLFISSNYDNLEVISKHTGFEGMFKDFKSNPFCSYSPANNKFVAYPNGEEASLFLIDQDLDQLEGFVIGDNDYLIYHENHTALEISDMFSFAYSMPCHHEMFDPNKSIEKQAFAIVLDVLLDDSVSPKEKTETIIARIMPEKYVLRKLCDAFLSDFCDKPIGAEQPCPPFFDRPDRPEMKEAFEELKTLYPEDDGYGEAYNKLQDLAGEYYYQ